MRLIIITIALGLAACSTHGVRMETGDVSVEPGAADDRQLSPHAHRAAASTSERSTPASVDSHDDVWVRIRYNLEMNRHTDLRMVRDRLAWYSRNQDYLDRVAERARPYLFHIVQELEARGMPADLALLPIIESAYHPFALSPQRASGLWQFIPGTGTRYGLKQNWWYDGRRDVIAATKAALDYLEMLHRKFDGDWLLALAAYNCGERNVVRAMDRNMTLGRDIDFWSLSPHLPRETRAYVPSLLAVAELVAGAERHGVALPPIANEPYFDVVALDGQIDLARAADLAGMTMEELYTLNPGFNQWATDPDGPHRLVLPLDRVERFSNGLATLPESDRISWRRHVIQRGETLGGIAARYGNSVDTLKQTNNLRGHLIRAGHSLLIPGAARPASHYTLSQPNRGTRAIKRSGSGNRYEYTVRQGDSLWTIGRKHEVSLRDLCEWNGITPQAILRPGQNLVLWLQEPGNAVPADSVGTVRQVALSAPAEEAIRYTVRKGDSLWQISRRFGVSVAQLRHWNGLSASVHLHPGQVLIVHRPQDTAGA